VHSLTTTGESLILRIERSTPAYSEKNRPDVSMQLYINLIPDHKRKQAGIRKKLQSFTEPVEVQIGDSMIWMWKIPYTEEEIEQIQENFWKQKFFFYWLDHFLKGSGNRQILRQMKNAVKEQRFGDYYHTDLTIRKMYSLYYLTQEFSWQKETKWFLICGDCLDGEDLLDYICYFLREVNCVFIYQSSIPEIELESIREESGLVVTKTRTLEPLAECDLVLDAKSGLLVSKRYLPKSLTYVDLTDDGAKKRFLQAKCKDCTYISLRNYLDRAFQSRV